MYYATSLIPIKHDKVLLERRSPYQTIRFDKTNFGLALYLNSEIQFIENEEKEYHNALARVPLLRNLNIRKILILGGGDGLAARTIFDTRTNCHIVMCELDPLMIQICASFKPMASLNKHALRKCQIVIGDASEFIKTVSDKTFDMVICDFPDMKIDTMNLYSPEILGHVARVLKPEGLLSIYSGGQYQMVHDAMLQDFKNLHDTPIQLKTMGNTLIISAVKK